ncbi:MAG: ABC transporter substrate-binding protein [Acetobacteraceae bacterium]|nr:ABC transporter substrate-binding protein [Acetobacteraceae bacterium]
MPSSKLRSVAVASVAVLGLLGARSARAEDMPGIGRHAIRIGNTAPYSGPASAYEAIARSDAAFFQMINDKGGINGRKIEFSSVDDGYDPARTEDETKKLVESGRVALVFNSVGTPTNLAVQPYLNDHGVPQLFIASGADRWADPNQHPWTMGWQPSYRIEAQTYAKYIEQTQPGAKIAILYQDDDFGRDYLAGVRDVLGADFDKRVVSAAYAVTDPTIVPQAQTLQASGASVLITAATPKFATQMIRRVYDLGWHPIHFVTNVSISVATVIEPAGKEAASGILSAAFMKDASDPAWKTDPGMMAYKAFLKKYVPEARARDNFYEYGYGASMTLLQVLKQCGSDLSRENIMRQAANLHDLDIPILLPGIKVDTSRADFHPISEMRLARWNGQSWQVLGQANAHNGP